MKKNNKKILKSILLISALVFVFMISTITLADVGNFNTYDSGSSSSSSSSWGSSSSSWDSGSSYSGSSSSSSGGIGSVIFVFVIVIIIIVLSKKGMINSNNSSTHPINIDNKQIVERIRQSDPNFSEEEFLMWTKDLFVKLQNAWTARDFESIRAFETPDLFEQHSAQLKEYVNMNRINVVERISVSYAGITNYESDGAKETITIVLNSKMKDYIIDSETKKLLEGNKDTYWNRSYRMKFVRTLGKQTQAASSELNTTNCPNCGAPTKVTSSGRCEYCGSVIVTDDHDWVLSSLESIRN